MAFTAECVPQALAHTTTALALALLVVLCRHDYAGAYEGRAQGCEGD
jgi:hypothetical protein